MLGPCPAVLVSLLVRATKHQPQIGDVARVQTAVTTIATHKALQLGTHLNYQFSGAPDSANAARAEFWRAMALAETAASRMVHEEWLAERVTSTEIPGPDFEDQQVQLHYSSALYRQYR